MKICIRESCIRCGRCVKVCPSEIFEQKKPGGHVGVHHPERCIVCGHCVAACPVDAVCHAEFPDERVHAIDQEALPSAEAIELLLASRRSNRVLTRQPVPQEWLDRIVAAADRAPTASNARQLGYTLVTDPALLRRITEYTFTVFGKVAKRLSNPLVRPWLRYFVPGVYRYVPLFERMRREYAEGTDRILRGATAVLFIHAPRSNRFGAEDANLAYQNASLVAEALGVSQVYMGFVLSAVRQDRNDTLPRMLGIAPDRRIAAVMALGIPEFRYPKYIDRTPAEVVRL